MNPRRFVLIVTGLVTAFVTACLAERAVGPDGPIPAILAVDRPTVQLFRFARGRMVVADTVHLSNNGEGPLGRVEQVGGIAYRTTERTGWLTTALVNLGNEEAILILRPTYAEDEQQQADTAEVVLKAEGSPDLKRVIVIARTLRGASFEFSVSPLAFAAAPGGPISMQTVTVRNGGNGHLLIHPPTIRYEDPAQSWLDLSRSGGTDFAPEFQVTADPGNLGGGLYRAFLDFESPAAEETRAKPASLEVLLDIGQPQLGVATSTQGFTAIRGAEAPPVQSILISNAGAGPFEALGTLGISAVSYGPGADGWLRVELEESQVRVGVITPGMAAGEYLASFSVDSDNGGSRTIQVILSVESPVLTVGAKSVSFGLVAGSPQPPAPDTVGFTNTGSGTVESLGETSLGGMTPVVPWLKAEIRGNDVVLTPTPASTALAVGSHRTVLPVLSAFGGSDTITVTLSVSPGQDQAVLALSSTALEFRGIRGDPPPPPQTIQISNAGGGDLGDLSLGNIQYAGKAGWLTALLPDSTLTLSAATGSLPEGRHTATVPVRSQAGGEALVDVAFTVGRPVLTASANSASFSSTVGGPVPPSQTLTLSNSGPGTFASLGAISVGPGGAAWLSVTNSGADLTLSVPTVPSTPGTYSTAVPVVSVEGGSLTIDVSLSVARTNDAPVLVASPDVVGMSGIQGGGNPSSQLVLLSNAGGGDLGALSVLGVRYLPEGNPKADGWLAATLDQATLILGSTVGSLPAGSYEAVVDLGSANGGDTSVSVTLSISGPVLTLSSESASFSAVQGGAASPVSIPVTVSNTGAGGFSSLGAVTLGPPLGGGGGWLSASLPPGSNTISIVAAAAGLAAGLYTDTIPVGSEHGGGAFVAVRLTVAPTATAPRLVLSADTVSFYVESGTDPASQRVIATNGAGGSFADLGTLTWDTTYVSGTAGWLLPALVRDTLILAATSTVNAAPLPDGTYSAKATVTSPADGSRTVTAVLSVAGAAADPDFELGTPWVSFTALHLGPDPEAREVPVINTGNPDVGNLNVESVTYGAGGTDWLDVSPTKTEVTLSPRTSQVDSAGSYSARVVVVDANGTEKDSVYVSFDVGEAELTLARRALSFDAVVGSGDPPADAIGIFNSGDGSFDDLGTIQQGPVDYDPAGNEWLEATIGSGSVAIQVTTAGLASGVYNATVPISSATGGSDTLTVTFTVRRAAADPVLSLSASSVAFVAVSGASSPPPKTVTLANAGGGSLDDLNPVTLTVVDGPLSWLPKPQLAGSAIIFSPSTPALSPGTYPATVQVASSGGTRTVQVDLEVLEPVMTASTLELSFTGIAGSVAPTPQPVTFSNTGAGTFEDLGDIRIEALSYGPGAAGWISSPTVGSLVSGTTVQFSPTISGMIPGQYRATVIISSERGGDQGIGITLSVIRENDPPLLALSPPALRFDALVGGGSPEPGSVIASNAGGGSLGALQTGPPQYGPGATGWLASTVSGTTITVQALTGGLPEGEYSASLPIGSQNGGTKSIGVTFVVGSPRLTLDRRTVSFGDTVGGLGPVPEKVAMANTGGGDFASLGLIGIGNVIYGGDTGNWLSVTRVAPDSVELRAETGNLSVRPSPYQALVPLTSAHGGADTVAVSFTVAAGGSPPKLSLSLDSMIFAGLVGGEDPASQTVAGFNKGGGDLGALGIQDIAYPGESTGWLEASISGSVVTLQPAISGLSGGIHTALVVVESLYGGADSLAVSLRMAQPILSLSSRTVTFSDTVGSPDTLQSQVFISNIGGGDRSSLGTLEMGTISYGAGASGWLQTDPLPGGTIGGNVVLLRGLAAGLPEGNSVAKVPVLSEHGGGDTVTVNFATREPDRSFDLPTIEFVKDTVIGGSMQVVPLVDDVVSVSAQAGDTAQAGIRVGVRNASETRLTLSGLRVGIPTYAQGSPTGWITGAFLDRTSATFSDPAELFVVVNPRGLTRGQFEGMLEVSSEAYLPEEVEPRVLRVTLVVR